MLVFTAALLLPLPPGLSRSATLAMAGLVAAVIFWASGVQDPAMTGLIIITALSALGVMRFAEATAGLGTEFVWLLAATFMIAQAMEDCGLGRRIALRILGMAGGHASTVLLACLVVVLVLSFMVPTAAGRIAMVLPICLGILSAADIQGPSNFAKAVLIGVSHTSIMAGIGLATAAGATVYSVGAFGTLIGVRWTYVAWMTAFLPPVILFTLVLWRTQLWVFPPERANLVGSAEYVQAELRRLGPLNGGERRMLAVFAGVYILWIVGPEWGITTAQAGVMGAVALLLSGMRLLTWERAVAAVKWNVLIIFAVALALANALESSGAARWLTDATLAIFRHPRPVVVALVLTPLVLLMRVGFVNNLGMLAAGLPLIFTLARGWGLSPQWAGMIFVMAAGPGFLLPTQSPTGLITLGYEYHTTADYLRSGIPASIALILLTWLAALFYWPLLGYGP
ncbi:MAG: SLC13 family permease [Armatimonadota bacterium]|nr:SLC13 family permease [Armatimonadota bacterium]